MPDRKKSEITSMYNEKVHECELLRSDNETLMRQVASLNRQNGGLKTSNANYRKQVTGLNERVEHYKELDKEGDELYEEKIIELDKLRKFHNEEFKVYKKQRDNELSQVVKGHESAMDEKQRTIESLSTQVSELLQKRCELESRCVCNEEYIAELEKK